MKRPLTEAKRLANRDRTHTPIDRAISELVNDCLARPHLKLFIVDFGATDPNLAAIVTAGAIARLEKLGRRPPVFIADVNT